MASGKVLTPAQASARDAEGGVGAYGWYPPGRGGTTFLESPEVRLGVCHLCKGCLVSCSPQD